MFVSFRMVLCETLDVISRVRIYGVKQNLDAIIRVHALSWRGQGKGGKGNR